MMGQIGWVVFVVVCWIIFFANVATFNASQFGGMFFTLLVLTVPTALWFSRHAIGRKMRESSAKGSINQVSTFNETQWGEPNRKNREERAVQLRVT